MRKRLNKQVALLCEVGDKNRIPLYELKIQDYILLEEEPKRPPIMINLKIENKSCSMELDTGGAVSIMSIGNFRKISNKQIKPTNVVFKTYEGESLIPLGYVTDPLPILEEIFGSLNGEKQFTKLDFKHVYLQKKVHPNSQKLMTINTHKGLYVCKRLIYGLNGAPTIWQHYVDGLFQAMDGVKVFMDDAKITGTSDASPVGIRCILSHVYPDGSERPIAFTSRTLSGSEKKYSQIDKALSIVWAVKKLYLCLKGRRFTFITDNKPLIAIFGLIKGLPMLAATRLLHYALILQSFEFHIMFLKTIEHGNADFLSRLPKTSEELEVKDDITIFQMSQIEALPVTSKELRQETGKDIELGPLLKALSEGKDLQGREVQYTIEDGCIMYGQRVCIPRKFQKNVHEELHAGHLGIVKMKAVARSFVYWKNIDKDIEEAAKDCVDCARYKADPPKSKVHYYEYPSMPWERIHVDFTGPIFEHTFFLIVDAHSKWLEVHPMKVTTTKKTIECLRDSFARFGCGRGSRVV
ncbi:uncharacterized protein K02A2.6 [Trichonephila clavipes]|nr:uncharacterized protein K02A2.6 [Trichonephila clavipes]